MNSGTHHSVTFSETFDFSAKILYNALIDLSRMHQWTMGMLAIEGPATMTEGLVYTAKHIMAGEISVNEVTVTKLTPNRYREIVNEAGIASYKSYALLEPVSEHQTILTCGLEFWLPHGMMRDIIETVEDMAVGRIRGNWEMLKIMLASESE